MRLSRRGLLVAGAGGVATLAGAPAQAARKPGLLRGGRFVEGVFSGDPTPSTITLATRLTGADGPGDVRLEIATDAGFRHVITRATLQTGPAIGHAVKARVTRLKPHHHYYYRFSGRSAESPVGQFRTALPPDSRQPVRFGVFAGLEFTSGYFNALALLAKEDVDFVLNLGNYINADQAFRSPEAVRGISFLHPAVNIVDYRRRYRDYRADDGLRAMHGAHAMVSTWDDGEVKAGYAGGRDFLNRRYAAYRAWYESMPHYPHSIGSTRLYQQRQFGQALSLVVLDTRQYRRAPSETSKSALLGAGQDRFLRNRVKKETGVWNIVASPAPIGPDSADGWSAYPREREELLAAISEYRLDAVLLSSGQRRFFAENVRNRAGRSIAAEFGCGSVTEQPDGAESEYAELARHGYAVVRAAPDQLTVSYKRVQSVRTVKPLKAAGSDYKLDRGQSRL